MSTVKGIYVLAISVSKDISINIGGLGPVIFSKGLYAYAGSAQNNLEKRIRRHIRKARRKFWHVDYLMGDEAVEVLQVFYKEAEKPEECKIAKKLEEIGIPIKGFGSSDCGCISHLFKLKSYQFLRGFMREAAL